MTTTPQRQAKEKSRGEQAMTARRDFVCNLYTSRERLYDALAPKKKRGDVCPNTSPLSDKIS